MRRCGVEMNEAVFLLEASSGDVRAAALLAQQSLGWAAPAQSGSVGSLTAATNLALAVAIKTSPPDDGPASPLDAGMNWPSMSQATVALTDDWDLIETGEKEDAHAEAEDWVELDDEVNALPPRCHCLVL